jgi:hypothetical protein
MAKGFSTQDGKLVPTCSFDKWQRITTLGNDHEGLAPLQVVEGCGFSMAMVVRFALGHSAAGGNITAFASDSVYGWTVLAAARHLLNAGSTLQIVIPGTRLPTSENGERLLRTLGARGAEIRLWDAPSWNAVARIVESSHNVLCGLSDLKRELAYWTNEFTEHMNESHVPVHVVGAPTGLDLDGNTTSRARLYASSTLSIGLPLEPLSESPDLIGRHYLADAGWSIAAYRNVLFEGEPLFAEQPVVRLAEPS